MWFRPSDFVARLSNGNIMHVLTNTEGIPYVVLLDHVKKVKDQKRWQ